MFGYTKPYSLDLTIRENSYYKAHYCGLCFALSRQYGPLWRACTNFDSTLLILLMSAQWPKTPSFTKVFCPLGSYRNYYIVDDDELFMKLGSAFTITMVDLKSQDALTDGARLAKPARFALKRAFARADSVLASNSFDTSSLNNMQRHQHELESAVAEDPSSVSFDELAMTTGHGLAEVFEYTSILSGLRHNAEPLRRIGSAAGKMIYAADCLEDLESDMSKARFNGLRACSMVSPHSHVLTSQASEGLQYSLDRCQAEMAYALEQLELVRYRPIIENILLVSLGLRISKLLAARSATATASKNIKVDGNR